MIFHVPGGELGTEHDTEQIDLDDRLEIGEVLVEEADFHRAGDACVVEHNV